jgi:PEP-CTERM motif
MQTPFFKIAGFVASLALVSTTHAALNAYNGFGAASSGFSTDFSTGNATGLTYGSLTTSGADANESLTINSGANSVAQLSSTASGTSVWLSWVYNPANSNEFGGLRLSNGTDPVNAAQIWFSPRNSGSGELFISSRGTSGGNQAFSTGQTLSFGTSYFMVVKLDTTAKTLDFWLNPTAGAVSPGTSTLSLTTAQLPTASIVVNSIGLLGGGSGGATYDEIRVGTTWADVSPSAIPEPSSYAALAGGALLGAALLRRRRR